MENMKKLYGYFDAKVISTGNLVPIYKAVNADEYFFHVLDEKHRIVEFTKFDLSNYKHDTLVLVNEIKTTFTENDFGISVSKLKNNVGIKILF